jgi:hypothetical protein
LAGARRGKTVRKADETHKTVDFDDGGRATLKADVLTLVEKAKQRAFT